MKTYSHLIHRIIHTRFKEELLFHCVINLPRHEVKKNRRTILKNFKTGKSFIGKSDQLLIAENNYINSFYTEKIKQKISLIKKDVWLIAIFEFKQNDLMTKLNIRKKTSPNLSNLYQIVEDCLQEPKLSKAGKLISKGASIIYDDDQIRSHDWSRIVTGDETRLHLYILDHEQAQEKIFNT